MKIVQTKLVATIVLACLALPGLAQAYERCEHGMDNEKQERMMDHEAEHKKLHDLLKLTAAQEAGWKTFASSMMPAQSTPKESPDDWDKLTTPQRADKMLELSKAHEQHMAAHVAALKTFYAELTLEQQKIFDDFHAEHHERRAHRMDKEAKPVVK